MEYERVPSIQLVVPSINKTSSSLPRANETKKERPYFGARKGGDLEHLEDTLRTVLKTKVSINGDIKKGKIEVHYFNLSELERIIEFDIV